MKIWSLEKYTKYENMVIRKVYKIVTRKVYKNLVSILYHILVHKQNS